MSKSSLQSDSINSKQYKKIPRPPPRPLIGNLLDIDTANLNVSIHKLRRKYGPIFEIGAFGKGGIILSNHEMIAAVCERDNASKVVSGPIEALRNGVGDGLFTAHTSEENWKIAHRLLIPAFGPLNIRDMFGQMKDIADQMILYWAHHDGQPFDMADSLTRLTLDTIALCGFSFRFNSFHRGDTHPFVAALGGWLAESLYRTDLPPIVGTVRDTLSKKHKRRIKLMHQVCDDIIAERERTGERCDDLLDKMLHSVDPISGARLSSENIRYQILTFLAAGHETTSGLLSFAIYYLVKNPETLKKARAEADAVDCDTAEKLSELVYIEAVLKEALRLRPTAPGFILASPEPMDLPGGYRLKAEEKCVMFLEGLHRDPKLYPDPEAFKPERCLPEAFEKLPKHGWKAFGHGQRACIGRGFAMQEAKLTLWAMLRHFDYELVDPNYELKVGQALTIKPNDLMMCTRLRSPISALINAHSPIAADAEGKAAAIPGTPAGKPINIAYGSNTGTCETFAGVIARDLEVAGFAPSITTLDAAVEKLGSEVPLLVLTSSYEGQPPDNAKLFVERLKRGDAIKAPFAVFGCGHRDWASTYQRVPTVCDELLAKAGASRLLPRGESDASGDFFGPWDQWRIDIIKRLAPEAKADIATHPTVLSKTLNVAHLRSRGRVTKVVRSGRRVHVEVALDQMQAYRCGDYLQVSPLNQEEQVARVLARFSVPATLRVHLADPPAGTLLGRDSVVALGDLLRGYLDLAQPVTKKVLEEIDPSLVHEEVVAKRISLIDLLEQRPSHEMTIGAFLARLPALQLRQYSIASSPLAGDEGCCAIGLDVIEEAHLAADGRVFKGVASNFLASLREGDALACAVKSSEDFTLPKDPQTPLVLFAAGSGMAPFRGFLQQRALLKQQGVACGPVTLFYGCRDDGDFMYADEVRQWEEQGVVSVHAAYSRQGEKQYIDAVIRQHADAVRQAYDQDAAMFTCGSATKLSKSVRAALCDVFDKTEETLDEHLDGRYAVDVFA